MQYTLQGNNGLYARAVFGQSIHLSGDNAFADPGLTDRVIAGNDVPNFSPQSGLQTDRSDYVAGLYLSPFSGISLVAQGRFDENDWTLRRQDTYLQANYGPVIAQARLHVHALRVEPSLGIFDSPGGNISDPRAAA